MSTRDASPIIRTISWRAFNPLEPDPECILIEDIARSLSNLCRYNGHVREFYSVAEHSYWVSHDVPLKDALWGLLHDASEAYLGDMMSPLKYHTPLGEQYRQIEAVVMGAVCQRFSLPPTMPPSVARADHAQLQREHDWLRSVPSRRARRMVERTMKPSEAEQEFLNRFQELTR